MALRTAFLASLLLCSQATAADQTAMPSCTVGGFTIASTTGGPTDLGQAIGRSFALRIRGLSALMAQSPSLRDPARARRLQACVASIRPEHRAEIDACAGAAYIEPQALIDAHLVVDAHCSAVVAMPGDGRPLRVARNMDFFPADVLGSQTVVQCWRGTGDRAVVSIGWPGFSGVVSGMNDMGLTACILLNLDADPLPPAEPLPLLVRHLLATCADVEAAVRAFTAAPTASGHYLLLADAAIACVVWRTPAGVRRADPVAGLLVADNGTRGDGGDACGERACRLGELARQQPAEFAWLRRCLTATYLASLNAQAMCFEPSTRRCELAIGGALRPASRQQWTAIDLGPLFTGGDPLPVLAQDLGRPEPLAHYAGDP